MHYTSVQSIRESSGLLKRQDNETPNGIVDGSNRIFVAKRRPIADRDNDDEVTIEDVTAYVNGIPVVIQAVEEATGKVTLTLAPAVSSKVTLDYSYSPISVDYVKGKAEEAESFIDTKLRTPRFVPKLKIPLDTVPTIISTVAELYASGLILTRDWGSRTDSSDTSKDGYAKIKLAEKLLDTFIESKLQEQKADDNTANNSVMVVTDPNIFSRQYDDSCAVNDEDFFMRRQ